MADLRSKQSRKEARLRIANAFIQAISVYGRHFFRYIDQASNSSRVSRFELDTHGRIWFVDGYRGARIYTHHPGRWRGFTNGGTLRTVVEKLCDYIRTGEQPHLALGPWPEWYGDGDPWGYGQDMIQVRAAARDLGLAPPLDCTTPPCSKANDPTAAEAAYRKEQRYGQPSIGPTGG